MERIFVKISFLQSLNNLRRWQRRWLFFVTGVTYLLEQTHLNLNRFVVDE